MTIETRPIEVVSAPKVKTTADVLRHAALIIEERGWCQADFENDEGAVCMVGGIIQATGYDHLGMESHRYLTQYLGGGPLNFNDTPGRTASEVTAALRAAADAAECAS